LGGCDFSDTFGTVDLPAAVSMDLTGIEFGDFEIELDLGVPRECGDSELTDLLGTVNLPDAGGIDFGVIDFGDFETTLDFEVAGAG